MEIYLQGVRKYGFLPEIVRLKVALIFQKTIRAMEQFIHTKKSGVYDSYILSTKLAFEEFVTFLGFQQWWEINAGHFEPEFRLQVEQKLETAKERGYNTSINRGS